MSIDATVLILRNYIIKKKISQYQPLKISGAGQRIAALTSAHGFHLAHLAHLLLPMWIGGRPARGNKFVDLPQGCFAPMLAKALQHHLCPGSRSLSERFLDRLGEFEDMRCLVIKRKSNHGALGVLAKKRKEKRLGQTRVNISRDHFLADRP